MVAGVVGALDVGEMHAGDADFLRELRLTPTLRLARLLDSHTQPPRRQCNLPDYRVSRGSPADESPPTPPPARLATGSAPRRTRPAPTEDASRRPPATRLDRRD